MTAEAKRSILLIDTEMVVAAGLQQTLTNYGFAVELTQPGEAAYRLLEENRFDLVLVDFDLTPRSTGDSALPETQSHPTTSTSGPGLVRELRAIGVTTPILIYTVLEGELYETASLDAGADDYIIKRAPISILLSRLHAHMRRRDRDLGMDLSDRRIRIGVHTLDRYARILLADDRPLLLSKREVKLLEKLAASPSRIVTSEELLDYAWGNDLRRSLVALASTIKRLRRKTEGHRIGDLIESVRSRGYRLALASPSRHGESDKPETSSR